MLERSLQTPTCSGAKSFTPLPASAESRTKGQRTNTKSNSQTVPFTLAGIEEPLFSEHWPGSSLSEARGDAPRYASSDSLLEVRPAFKEQRIRSPLSGWETLQGWIDKRVRPDYSKPTAERKCTVGDSPLTCRTSPILAFFMWGDFSHNLGSVSTEIIIGVSR